MGQDPGRAWAMPDIKGKLRHSPALMLGTGEGRVAAPAWLTWRCQLLELCPAVLLALSRQGRRLWCFAAAPRHKGPFPYRSSWPLMPGASVSLWHTGCDTALLQPHQRSINHLCGLPASASFCSNARGLVLPQLGEEHTGTSSFTSSSSWEGRGSSERAPGAQGVC